MSCYEDDGAMQERRTNTKDRRQRAEELPLQDSDSDYVTFERRYFPDRRESHYDPKWDDTKLSV